MDHKTSRIAAVAGSLVIALLGLAAWLLTAQASPLSAPSDLPVENQELAAFSTADDDGVEGWENAGLYGGTVILAAFDPLDDAIYLAVSGAHYKSTDGGQTWSKVTNQGGNACVAVDPISGTVYLGVNSDIWTSNDSGATWDVNSDLVGNAAAIALDPQDGQAAFIGTGRENVNVDRMGYVHRTLDGGANWETVSVDPGYCISSLAVDPNNTQHVWAVSGPCGTYPDHTAVFSSTDRGASFSMVLTSTYGYDFSQIAFGPDGVLYLVGDGVRVSHNSGITFTNPVLTSTIYLDFNPMAINPITGRAHVNTYTGGMHSDDGGLTWIWDGLPKIYGIDPENPLHMLGHSGQGLRRSTNGGNSWQAANTGIRQVIVDEVGGNPQFPEVVYASTHRGFGRSLDGGHSWDFPVLGSSTRGFAVSPLTSTVLYVGDAGEPWMHISRNSGDTWQDILITTTQSTIQSVAVDPITPTTIYAGLSSRVNDPASDTSRDGLYVSSDDGLTWTRAGLPGEQVNVVAATADISGTTVYAGVGDQSNYLSTGGVYRQRAGESDWTPVGMADAIVNVIAVDPLDADHVYCGVGAYGPGQSVKGLYESSDGGDHWTKVVLQPDDSPVWSILFDPVDPDILYVGIGGSLYRSLDGGATWLLDTELEGGHFVSVYISPSAPATIYAGLGDGVYRRSDGAVTTVGATEAGTISFTDTQGTVIALDIPVGAVTQTTAFYLHNAEGLLSTPTDFPYVGSVFLLNAFQNGLKVDGFIPLVPITVTMHYTAVSGIDEASIMLYTLSGSQWVDAATTCIPASTYNRHPNENWLAVPICHLSEFALLGKEYSIFLPLILLH